MFSVSKILVFISLLAVIYCKQQFHEVADIRTNVVEANPARMVFLTQLNATETDSGKAIYTYKCTVGTHSSNRLACTARDSTSWPSSHDVQLKLRCPKSGSGLILSYVEIIYSVSSNKVDCYVNEGAVGLGYIGLTVNAWNTLLFSYSANFYSY